MTGLTIGIILLMAALILAARWINLHDEEDNA